MELSHGLRRAEHSEAEVRRLRCRIDELKREVAAAQDELDAATNHVRWHLNLLGGVTDFFTKLVNLASNFPWFFFDVLFYAFTVINLQNCLERITWSLFEFNKC